MWKVILLVTAFLLVLENASSSSNMKCPPFGSIPGCWCMEQSYLFRGPYVNCDRTADLESLKKALAVLQGNPIEALQLYNTSLTSLPRSGIFQGLHIEYLWLDTSKFKSLAPEGTKGPSPFAGLENTLTQIKLEGLDQLDFVDWSELSGLVNLQKIEVARCNLGVIDKSFATLPSSFKYLNVFDGGVKSIDEGAFALENIGNVAVEFNKIPRLDRNIFAARPSNLTAFMFSLNQLEELSDDFFSGFPALNFADISRNNLTKLPTSLRDNFNAINQVYLAGNPYVCDCDLVWLLRAAKSSTSPPFFYNDLPFVKCGSPANLKNRTLVSLQEEDLCPSH